MAVVKINSAAPHRGQPVEDLHTGGHGDEHRGDTEKAATESGPMPETNMWWAHTPQPMNPMAMPEKTMNG